MMHDYLVIGESIAAGTTTALGVLRALDMMLMRKSAEVCLQILMI